MENLEQASDPNNSDNSPSSDDDDVLRLFESRRDPRFAKEIIRIKLNDPEANRLHVNIAGDLDERAWRRLGDILGQNTIVEKLCILYGNPGMVGLCAGLQHNRYIQNFNLSGTDLLATEMMNSLTPFLSSNPSLRKIILIKCNLGQASINILSNALSNRSEDTLEELNLSDNNFGDIDLDGLVLTLNRGKALRSLQLNNNGIGLKGCVSLARQLRSQESNVKWLYLGRNSIDNDSAIILADSLKNNTKLEQLALGGNNITAPGWSAMLKLVCNCSSIDGATESNHSLNDLGMLPTDLINGVIPSLGVDDTNLLRESLCMNRTSNKMLVARRKILWSHARGDLNLGDSPITNGAMPRILAWIGNDSNETHVNLIQYHRPSLPKAKFDTFRLDSVFRIFWSMPDLCKINDI